MRYVVMGATGCGKTTLAHTLSDEFGIPFRDGDDLHPLANIAKMGAGLPLDDADREPWLEAVAGWLAANPEGGVVACSALKRKYRDQLRLAAPDAAFIFLDAPQAVLEPRVRARRRAQGSFAPVGILDGQFRDLEVPDDDEAHLRLDVEALDARATAAAAIEWVGSR